MLTNDMMKDAVLSDLFFNSQQAEECFEEDAGYDPDKLLVAAKDFASGIETLTDGAIKLAPEAVVADFIGRL